MIRPHFPITQFLEYQNIIIALLQHGWSYPAVNRRLFGTLAYGSYIICIDSFDPGLTLATRFAILATCPGKLGRRSGRGKLAILQQRQQLRYPCQQPMFLFKRLQQCILHHKHHVFKHNVSNVIHCIGYPPDDNDFDINPPKNSKVLGYFSELGFGL